MSRVTGAKVLPWYGLSIIAAMLAMKTKEIAFMLPLTVTLYEFVFFQGRTGRRLLYVIPLLLIMLIIPLTLFSIDMPAEELLGQVNNVVRGHTNLSRWEYLTTSFRVITTYIRLIFLPVHLNFDYDYKVYRSFLDAEIIISFVFLLSIFGLAVYLFSRYRQTAPHARLISFGIFWFFFNLLLESSIIPLNNVISEHRVYLPSIGIFLAVMVTVFTGVEKLKNKGIHVLNAVTVVLSFIVIVLTVATYTRNNVWKDEASLWGDVVSRSPNKFFPHYNLGNAYLSRGLIEKAIEEYQIAITINPYFSSAHYNLGIAYQSRRLFEKAIEEYQITINLFPSHVKALTSISNLYMYLGLTDKAIVQYRSAIQIDQENPGLHINLGNAYLVNGLTDKAIEQYMIALKYAPKNYEAHNNIGLAYQAKGNSDKAREYLEAAERLKQE
jgi:tetratricopeptide (TPR) repeat protein